jgi:hypothetical protein
MDDDGSGLLELYLDPFGTLEFSTFLINFTNERIIMTKLNVEPYLVNNEFPFEEDIFKREGLIKSIVRMAERLDETLVMGINAQWGLGKTTLISRLEAYINLEHKESFGIIRYDAFRNDFVSDVFVSFTSAIAKYLDEEVEKEKETNPTVSTKIKEARDTVLQTGGKICKAVIKNALVSGIKYSTAGFVNFPEIMSDIETLVEDTINESADDMAQIAVDDLGKIIKERFEKSNQDIGLVATFAKKLENAIKETGKERIIFVVDELDRCNPCFSVEVLEKIKHFFPCKNILFILVYNKKQLENSVKHMYGVDKPDVYLQRFINIEVALSITPFNENSDNYQIQRYTKWLVTRHELSREWETPMSNAIEDAHLFWPDDIALRTIERICTKVASYELFSSQELSYDKYMVAFLSVLYIAKSQIYDDVKERSEIVANYRGESQDLPIERVHASLGVRELLDVYEINTISGPARYETQFDRISYYLFVSNPNNGERNFVTERDFFTNRNTYINNICNMLNTFNIA